jgi:hypothetical protein
VAKEIVLDLSKFTKDLDAMSAEIAVAARSSLHDIMDDWKREAINIAPLDKSTLRRSIHYRTSHKGTKGINIEGQISASAIEVSDKWGRFNYAYYIHEEKGDSFKGSTSGTEGRFLDIPAEKNEKQWIKQLEDDIREKIRGRGF